MTVQISAFGAPLPAITPLAAVASPSEAQRFYSERAQAKAMAARPAAAVAPSSAFSDDDYAADLRAQAQTLVSPRNVLAPPGSPTLFMPVAAGRPGFFARHGTKLLIGGGVLAVGGLVTWMLLKPTRGLRPAMAGLGRRRRARRGRR